MVFHMQSINGICQEAYAGMGTGNAVRTQCSDGKDFTCQGASLIVILDETHEYRENLF